MRICALLLLISIPTVFGVTTSWPQFRGPDADGKSNATGLPVEAKSIKWRAATHGKAWSSPVVWDNQVWVTTATEDGKQLGVMCFDAASGKVLHDKKLWDVADPQFCHKFNSYASPTPVIEDGRLYISFGSPGIGCLDTKTCTLLWERRDFVCNHFRGAGSSPVVWKNLMILPFDGSDHQFIVALDKTTGTTVWKVERSIDYKDLQPDGKPEADGDWRKGFGTPRVIEWNGKPLLLSSGAKAHYGYEPETGKEVFRFEERGAHSPAACPVVGDGMWFITPGFGAKQVIALKLGGQGVLDESAVAWREKKGAPNKPSLIYNNGYLYMVDDNGVASCLDAKTGTVQWRERVGGDYSASPLLAGSYIYFLSENGSIQIIKAAPKFEKVAEWKFDDGFMASPAVSGNSLYVRTRTALYCLQK